MTIESREYSGCTSRDRLLARVMVIHIFTYMQSTYTHSCSSSIFYSTMMKVVARAFVCIFLLHRSGEWVRTKHSRGILFSHLSPVKPATQCAWCVDYKSGAQRWVNRLMRLFGFWFGIKYGQFSWGFWNGNTCFDMVFVRMFLCTITANTFFSQSECTRFHVSPHNYVTFGYIYSHASILHEK